MEEKEKVEVQPEVEDTPEVTEKPDAEKSLEELETEAKEAENLYKQERDTSKEDEIRANMIRRRDKAIAKNARLHQPAVAETDDIAVRDLITLGKADILENSEKAKVLEKYKRAGIITDYATGLSHHAIQAEFAQLENQAKAEAVINENNASDDARYRTVREAINEHKLNGTIPEDPKLRQAMVDESLKEMGI